jgi:hypothetical protein
MSAFGALLLILVAGSSLNARGLTYLYLRAPDIICYIVNALPAIVGIRDLAPGFLKWVWYPGILPSTLARGGQSQTGLNNRRKKRQSNPQRCHL